jgi:hypothetical protein
MIGRLTIFILLPRCSALSSSPSLLFYSSIKVSAVACSGFFISFPAVDKPLYFVLYVLGHGTGR